MRRCPGKNRILRAIWIWVVVVGCAGATVPAFATGGYDLLQKRLSASGRSSEAVRTLFSGTEPPRLKNVALYMRIRESKLNYHRFLEPDYLAMARRFLETHAEALHRAREVHQVDPTVVVAILLVETRLGTNTGSHPVVPSLAAFALMEQKTYRDRVWRMLSAKDRKRWGRKRFDDKLTARARWALQELDALARLAERGQKVSGLQGSFMGAVGWAQFMPTSMLRYGADGNGDGVVDLFAPEDAFMSIANYLRSHGWKDSAPLPHREKVLLRYNNSSPYARTVLEIARRLNRNP
ncbi:membrane-bound lytic murein transglycosylase B [Desulfacinum infernum DSM 9756]|jgi:membrane-bound lytic murein transglycosylase B|uniref:Membrane-bound lytic murein transglycosylase B n=1 Tax=Desulfacinum infernum DSM 9756 TaxID=1121391 RepID=A0A1M5G2Y6_9BACT|nr:lytic murein transglycosylase [Desulfacinum infernum]SHF97821.1 membrane-bound lytic murein transglycosylase B [Desulfacinum infernum DSM 9756]